MKHANLVASAAPVVLFALAVGAAASEGGCSGDAAGLPQDDAGAQLDSMSANPPPDALADAAVQSVTFHYTPLWKGATSVTVVGGFGQPSDWSKTDGLVKLVDDGTGTFTGTAQLPAGQYLYVFRVSGDDAGSSDGGTSALTHYAVDPGNPGFAPCPAASPTYNAMVMNPCSQLTLPGATAPLYHVTGTAHVDAQAASGYLVVLEREEMKSHHFFVNRVTVGPDGTFGFMAAAGTYRIQILHPTFYSTSDVARNPLANASLLRAISSAFPVAGDVTLVTPDVAFHDYASFAPADGGATLPTHFKWGGDGGSMARLAIYGGANSIGDPWYSGPLVGAGASDFDGGFNTTKATTPAVQPGTRYFWGTESHDVMDGGVTWTGQTMVFPITWQ